MSSATRSKLCSGRRCNCAKKGFSECVHSGANSKNLLLGIVFLPLAISLFGGYGSVGYRGGDLYPPVTENVRFRELCPDKEETRRSVAPMLRGSVLEVFVGPLLGPCAVILTILSYAVEKKVSKTIKQFGKGMIEGGVAPELANNTTRNFLPGSGIASIRNNNHFSMDLEILQS